jgi:cell wall-associated NlpC family hydrolase
MSRALVAVATGMVALPVAAVVVLSTGLSATAPIGYTTTTAATTDIPPAYLRLYQADAALCPGLGWPVLAGVGKVESDHGRAATLVSDTGAAGPMQVEPGTWAGYGVDADRDGRADPFDAADAVATAALYLCRLGADHDVRDALIAYNCGNSGPACQAMSAGYASLVLRWAGRYAVTSSGRSGTLGAVAVRAALSQLGTPYLWGGGSPAGFDCSGLSQWSYARAGLSLPRTAQQQYDAGPAVPAGSGLTPGDLVFFGTGPTGVDHVGIYMGNGRMVDAPHTGATVRIDPVAGFTPAYVGATAPTGLG